MPRIDDYEQALKMGKGDLSDKNPDLLARFSGAEIQREKDGRARLFLQFLNQEMTVSWPDLLFSYRGTEKEVPIQQQILALHYLRGAHTSSGSRVTGEWISFQEIPDGRFYLDAFHRRAKNPLVQAFGERPELLLSLARETFGAILTDQGDAAVVIRAFPLVPVALILWKGDDEFSPEGNILFDRNVREILSAEDVAWLSGMIVYPLMGMARG